MPVGEAAHRGLEGDRATSARPVRFPNIAAHGGERASEASLPGSTERIARHFQAQRLWIVQLACEELTRSRHHFSSSQNFGLEPARKSLAELLPTITEPDPAGERMGTRGDHLR